MWPVNTDIGLLFRSAWGGIEAAARLEAIPPLLSRWQIKDAFRILFNVIDLDMK